MKTLENLVNDQQPKEGSGVDSTATSNGKLNTDFEDLELRKLPEVSVLDSYPKSYTKKVDGLDIMVLEIPVPSYVKPEPGISFLEKLSKIGTYINILIKYYRLLIAILALIAILDKAFSKDSDSQ